MEVFYPPSLFYISQDDVCTNLASLLVIDKNKNNSLSVFAICNILDS